MTKLHYLTLSLLLILGFTSCSDSGDSTPAPITKANIIGSVNLYDEGTMQIENSGMTVKLEVTGFSATTDTNGDFTLLDSPFGTYILIYEKSGFGTFKTFNLEHTNTGAPTIITVTPSLGETSTTQVTELAASVNGNDVLISATTNPAGNNGNTRYVRYFLSADSNVSNENYTYYSPGLVSQINPYEITLSQNDLTSAGFSSGQTVYVKVYGDSFFNNEYEDTNLGRKVFPNLNTTSANSVSFVVP
jgi:hypothetical protein